MRECLHLRAFQSVPLFQMHGFRHAILGACLLLPLLAALAAASCDLTYLGCYVDAADRFRATAHNLILQPQTLDIIPAGCYPPRSQTPSPASPASTAPACALHTACQCRGGNSLASASAPPPSPPPQSKLQRASATWLAAVSPKQSVEEATGSQCRPLSAQAPLSPRPAPTT